MVVLPVACELCVHTVAEWCSDAVEGGSGTAVRTFIIFFSQLLLPLVANLMAFTMVHSSMYYSVLQLVAPTRICIQFVPLALSD